MDHEPNYHTKWYRVTATLRTPALENKWGPFSSYEKAEDLVIALAAREDIARAEIFLLPNTTTPQLKEGKENENL